MRVVNVLDLHVLAGEAELGVALGPDDLHVAEFVSTRVVGVLDEISLLGGLSVLSGLEALSLLSLAGGLLVLGGLLLGILLGLLFFGGLDLLGGKFLDWLGFLFGHVVC